MDAITKPQLVRVKRWPVIAAVIGAIGIFAICLVPILILFRYIVWMTVEINTPMEGKPRPVLDTIIVCAFFAFIAADFVIAWLGYKGLRWKYEFIDGIKCLECMYDLTGNVSGVCPECGTPAASTSRSVTISKLD